MGKVVLQKVGETYYNIPVMNYPLDVFKPFGTASSMSEDKGLHVVDFYLDINMVETESCKSNRELVDSMLDEMDANNIVKIESLNGMYRAVIEYALMNQKGEIIEQSSIVSMVAPKHSIIPLGIDINNECVYRHILVFDIRAIINNIKHIPIGVMHDMSDTYKLLVTDLSIYHAKDSLDALISENNSVYGNRYSANSVTISQIVKNSVCIFSVQNEGLKLSPMTFKAMPRKINLNFRLSLGNIIEVYDESTLIDLFDKNKDELTLTGSRIDLTGNPTTDSATGPSIIVDYVTQD